MRLEATKPASPANWDHESGIECTAAKVALRRDIALVSSKDVVGNNDQRTVAEARLYTTTVKGMLHAHWLSSESMQQIYLVKGDPASARKSSGALRLSALPGACRALAARPAAWIAFEWRA
jgi:hypothetical protein